MLGHTCTIVHICRIIVDDVETVEIFQVALRLVCGLVRIGLHVFVYLFFIQKFI